MRVSHANCVRVGRSESVGNVNCKVGQCMKLDPKVRYVSHFVVRLKALVDFSSICKKNVDIFKSFT